MKHCNHTNETTTATRPRPGEKPWQKFFCCAVIASLVAISSLFNTEDAKAQARFIDMGGNIVEEAGQSVHPDDSLALVAFYHAANGDTWLDNAGWLVDQVFAWVGVRDIEEVAEGEWRVVNFSIPRNNLTQTGTIAPETAEMIHLRRFEFRDLILIGGVPPEFGNLEHLRQWQIRGTLIGGELPWVGMSQMPFLEYVQAQSSFFRGDIPADIGSMANMTRFDIRSNEFSGPLDEEAFQSMGNLQRLLLNDNLFTGPIPDLGELENFTHLHFDNVPFEPGPLPDWLQNHYETFVELRAVNSNRTGTVPEWVTELEQMIRFHVGEHGEWIDLEGNVRPGTEGNLGGPIPDMSFMVNLQRISIEGAGFTGAIDEWWADMPNAQWLVFDRTHYEGELPASLANLTTLERLQFLNNPYLTGGIPAEYSQMTNLASFRFVNNPGMVVGEMPKWVSELTNIGGIAFSNVGLTGEIPDEWQSLDRISSVDLSYNPGVTGGIPQWMQQREEIVSWNLSYTGMELETIPEFLNNVTNLSGVSLAGLGLTGEIPDWLVEGGNRPARLTTINLADNNLTGSIPEGIGGLIRLRTLDLSNNSLSGEIPPSMVDMGRFAPDRTAMRTVRLSGNPELSGELPVDFVHATEMRIFEYDGTQICEPPDAALIAWLEETIPANAFTSFPAGLVSVKRTNISCDDTSVPQVHLPERVHLHQNYPNPFNPATTIRYDLPADMHVTLRIYNVLGQQVAMLVNEVRSAGSHQVSFNAAELSSGSYIYRLETEGRVLTQTMMLLK